MNSGNRTTVFPVETTGNLQLIGGRRDRTLNFHIDAQEENRQECPRAG